MAETKPPNVFISYAWEDDLKTWVLDFATRLRSDGINAILDQWETVPGDQLPEFMEKSVRESDFVVFVCTPTYKRKSDRRKGGVGYEGHIITGEVFQKNNHRKFIPILRKGKWGSAAPSWATSKLFIDFRGDPYSEASYLQLLNTLFGRSPTAPPLRDDSFREKIEREDTERAERERLEREAAERLAQEKAAREKAEKDAIEKAEPDAADKLAREKGEKEAKENEKRKTAEKAAREKVEPRKTASLRQPNTAIIVALIGLIGTIGAALISLPLLASLFERTPEPTSVISTPTNTKTPSPSATRPPATHTSAPPLTFTSTPGIGSFIESDGVTMMFIPAGPFSMGSDQYDDEKPIHAVSLSAYYIDKYEVTNAAYGRCVDAGVCNPPKQSSSYTRTAYYGNPEFDEFPVIYVDWNMAKTYCEWRGDRLPTEAEWEKAARGADERTYPWGEGISCDNANFAGCKGDTTKVGSYLEGVSPYGVYDMAGNVWEWVNDWYDSNYYQNSPAANPLGPDSGQYRVLRGGSWYSGGSSLRVSDRVGYYSDSIYDGIGFRCVRSP